MQVRRADGSEESGVLNSRSFLRHDLAHLAVETQMPLARGYWGSVADGAKLNGLEIRGPDIMLAEKLSGPVQTLMRIEAIEAEQHAVGNQQQKGRIQHGSRIDFGRRDRRHSRKCAVCGACWRADSRYRYRTRALCGLLWPRE